MDKSRVRKAPQLAIVRHPFGTDCLRSLWVSVSCFVAEKSRQRRVREGHRKTETDGETEATLRVTAPLSMKGRERVGPGVGV